ncbi:quinol:cytochrome c oxidoreductase pentaheme cytochrome subunit [Sphingomonas gellani]|uniref:Quinol:cytochrome c oxidoreductase pentaheme cytochrome subunit n=1 Tax=Sphingomonas gellani TaxID=1166340 RepID=A0A1H7ZGM9_9SPHN|nr:cytochrome c3 family protein [Sphingomonas gellani]SEM57423.1 quinol:cytochrome c oxidoreductase pentaheme cytochrome subunit [Sphingomonas gellani]
MAQLFRPGANTYARLLLALPLLVAGLLFAGMVVARSGTATGEGRFVEQPVPFSHQHHAGELGIDCRYCHAGVETGAHAGVPPTHTCMTCHYQLYTNAQMLAPVRDSLASGRPIAWRRVNRLPDYVYFDHHAHVNNGVPCAACHGDIRRMPLTRQATPMSMGWCLDCHRAPEERIVAPDRVYSDAPYQRRSGADRAAARATTIRIAHSGRNLTDCSTCHR